MSPVISVQGFIQPEVPPGTGASVVAVYDQAKILQYVGFSKDLRQTLRTVFGRRPDRAHFFKAAHLPEVDQQAMVDVRTAWFAENAGPPAGNKLAAERAAWQAPAQSFSISERGKAAAAEELAKQLLLKIRNRGCREDFFAGAPPPPPPRCCCCCARPPRLSSNPSAVLSDCLPDPQRAPRPSPHHAPSPPRSHPPSPPRPPPPTFPDPLLQTPRCSPRARSTSWPPPPSPRPSCRRSATPPPPPPPPRAAASRASTARPRPSTWSSRDPSPPTAA
jgi:hypothetical protein